LPIKIDGFVMIPVAVYHFQEVLDEIGILCYSYSQFLR
jgi:hypothetical protein